ncbi:MAG: glycosyltransferase [Candidatus Omnitrophica bacterium]|nr:glycosyltransferase [Candidatus Omnitrophota bacterium]
MKVSLIVRSKNEERWISSCLQSVFNQSYRDFEVIVVDNNSTDGTIAKAKKFDTKILTIDSYLPGKALNLGIKASNGDFLVSLSAHCIPKGKDWLVNLLQNFDDPDVAGVYGRQEPMNQTTDLDKRDLWIIFGLDKRVQVKDSFFHNANSMIRRSLWEKIPFDENVTNIEDRIWAKEIIKSGYKIIYEPEASVYHYHGIHQSADAARCSNIVKIMESREPISHKERHLIENLNITAIIPVKGEVQYLCGRPLIEYTLERAKESKFIDKVIVSTDNPEIAEISRGFGAEAPFRRPVELSLPEVSIEEVLKYSVMELEGMGQFADLVIYLGAHAPFRPHNLIDGLIELLFHNGLDSALCGQPTYKSSWQQQGDTFMRLDEGFAARKVKKPIHSGYPGLACVTYPEFIRQGRLLGDKVGIFEIIDLFSVIEITDAKSQQLAEKAFPDWWKKENSRSHQDEALFCGPSLSKRS